MYKQNWSSFVRHDNIVCPQLYGDLLVNIYFMFAYVLYLCACRFLLIFSLEMMLNYWISAFLVSDFLILHNSGIILQISRCHSPYSECDVI